MLQHPVVFFDTSGCEFFERLEDGDADEGSRCNENEGTLVKNWVDKLVRLIPSTLIILVVKQHYGLNRHILLCKLRTNTHL